MISEYKVLTLFVSFIGLFIVYRQYVLDRYKYRKDLYEKRFYIYTEFKKVLANILVHGDFDEENLDNFYISQAEANFLFKEDHIVGLFEEIRLKGIELNMQNALLKNDSLEVGIRESAATKIEDLRGFLSNNF